MPKECGGLDREHIKRNLLALEKQYDKITFGLKIVRDHMGGMITQIKDLSRYIYDTEKWALKCNYSKLFLTLPKLCWNWIVKS